jgi:hypothetical protein
MIDKDVLAPGVGAHRIDRLPNDVKVPEIYSAYHDWLEPMMVGVHHRGFIDYGYFTARRSKTISGGT